MTEQAFEAIMEAVCSICHHPYVETEQEALDAVCENCPVECKIRAVMEGV
jgi:hypothetical protein